MSQTLETHLLIPNRLTMNQALSISILSFFNWVCIPALLVSPALAQVNGPGPSPSSLFDTVLNLPGDEAVVTGADFESIGSFEQTTQLNVSDGGAVGFLFFADNGEVNISGGTVGDIFTSLSNSEVNISGGTVGDFFDAGIGSVVNISGGTVGNFFTANSGSEVNISGGTVGNDFFAIFGSEVNIFGSEFFIDGVELETLLLGEAFTITDRDVTPVSYTHLTLPTIYSV